MKLLRRQIVAIPIAIVVLFLLIFWSAPNDPLHPGSTYSRDPQGYGAWYAYMRDRQFPIYRWEQPLPNFWSQKKGTLLQIFPLESSASFSPEAKKWMSEGNTLIMLGIGASATAADFNQSLPSSVGVVQIETTRRFKLTGSQTAILGDRFGAIILQEPVGKGKSIQVITPYLAANAYQDLTGNFALLTQLLDRDAPIWVDEYLHGYRDKQTMALQGERDWIRFLGKTPLIAITIQGIILLGVVIWSQNQRFGLPRALETVKTDNSQAYIHSLAAVLNRAAASEFVIQAIGQAEQLQLQRKLGLGTKLLSHQELINAWVQTGRPKSQLIAVLEPLDQKQRLTEKRLLVWLEQWQHIVGGL